MSTPASTQVPESPLVSVSIVSHGDAEPLQALLTSLAAHENAGALQLIITDNLGRDLPEIQPSGWHSVVMLRNARPLGFAANHNVAFQHVGGQYFCVLNPDALFLGSVFRPLMRRFERRECDLAAPIVVDSQGRVQDSFRRLPSPSELVWRRMRRSSLAPEPAAGAILHPDWVAGTFMLMSSQAFSRLSGFDSRFRLYFEDVDLCTRARLMGMTILVDAGLRLQHDPRRASRTAGRYLLWHVQSALRFFASDVYRRARRMNAHV